MLCMFSSLNKEIASTKVTSKFHAKDRVVSSSLTLPTKCPADGIGIHTGLRDQVFRVRLPGGVQALMALWRRLVIARMTEDHKASVRLGSGPL